MGFRLQEILALTIVATVALRLLWNQWGASALDWIAGRELRRGKVARAMKLKNWAVSKRKCC